MANISSENALPRMKKNELAYYTYTCKYFVLDKFLPFKLITLDDCFLGSLSLLASESSSNIVETDGHFAMILFVTFIQFCYNITTAKVHVSIYPS